ncbi:MAG: radical SAM protein [Anaerolineae bacterium]|nr:radical SAM protein [Anaerolineae bacterium]
MTSLLDGNTYLYYLPPELRGLNWRTHSLDGALLLFERDTGLNVLLEGDETAHLQRVAPRTLLIAVTNVCNLKCHFCYRNLKSPSEWTYDSLLKFCQRADEWGVLEVAFGGGEPMLFKDWQRFIHELYDTSGLCINFTTNGMLLTEDFLRSIAGKYGNIRLSLYDDNHWEQTIDLMVGCGARFGVNWLMTPDILPQIESMFLKLLTMGVRDFLLLSYKGADSSMHLSRAQIDTLTDFVNRMYQSLNGLAQIKLDVCWGDALPDVPRLFNLPDCGAGDEFLSITSDKHIKPCSFHHWVIPFETLDDVRAYWQHKRQTREAAAIAGCARLPQRALSADGIPVDETIYSVAVPSPA